MINPVKVNDIIKNEGDSFTIVQKYENVDGMFGIDYFILTDEDIKALKDGRYLYYDDGEYALLVSYAMRKG